ncbi:hypothetical protein R1sor_019148 [Riccia sorocarpa]|uniref:Uncharacterized protein n=1 Tax=Riccia sorocarpa TaxID=122646 RepID=A0ABD3IFT4_9MARC
MIYCQTTALAEGIVGAAQAHAIDTHEIVNLSCTPEKNDAAREDLDADQGKGLLPETSSHELDWLEDPPVRKFCGAAKKNSAKSSHQPTITSVLAPASSEHNLTPHSFNESGKHRESSSEDYNNDQDVHIRELDRSPRKSPTVTEDKEQVVRGSSEHIGIVEVVDKSEEIAKCDADERFICDTAAPHETEHFPFGEDLEEDNSLTVTGFGFHRCRYSSGFVNTTESGLIILASPPSLRSGRLHSKRFGTSRAYMDEKNVKSPRSLGVTLPERDLRNTGKIPLNPPDVQVKVQAITKSKSPGVESVHIADVNFGPQEYSPLKVTSAVPYRERESENEGEKVSSRLAAIATQGVVPSSPVREPILDRGNLVSPVLLKTPLGCTGGPGDGQERDHTSFGSSGKHESTPTTPMPAIVGTVCARKCDPKGQGEVLTTDSRSKKKTPVSSFLCRINGLSPPKGKLLRFTEDCPNSGGKDASMSRAIDPLVTREGRTSVEVQDLSKIGTSLKDVTTPQGRSSESPSEVWELSEAKGSLSVQKPRKLKRLRKAGEETNRISSSTKLKRLKNASGGMRQSSKSSRPKLKEGKNQMKQFVRNFVDEEAEVSDDDESSDEDVSGEDEDEVDGFIDSAGTQHLNGSVDMMAVYRRSLFTQSPADLSAQYAHLQGTSPATCSDGTPRSSEDISGSTVPGSSSEVPPDGSSPVRIDSDARKPFVQQVSRFLQSNAATADAGNTNASCAPILIHEEQKKLDLRKRKLSFQPSTASGDVSTHPSHDSGSGLLAGGNQRIQSSELVNRRDPVVDFEDDLFDGVDLDALEAQAAQTCRSRSQKVVDFNQEPHQKQDIDASSVDFKQPKPRLLSRLRQDDNFGDYPSFDLGLAD